MKRIYYVISTLNAQINGWSIYGEGTKKECRQIQLNNPAFQGIDIYADTLNKNSKIVSRTEAKRKFKLDV
jgi:hypothetical protein